MYHCAIHEEYRSDCAGCIATALYALGMVNDTETDE